ncbi:BTAD domain-containing putative transcriptional regulator [Streptomyces yaanensis]|uniref:BTAD domain-containing putative transcriptional regulator n=1 Tax=Streptomyces yaanensis TaxID=1142239 RepID=A0ABV7SDX9_9ACTN|nr:BTAD domain-containing putative transcriptional regulator [Streptomyces sp. CGMCC 4.7035]WNB99348.1 BTAD domain-containing putative transcriptional regulator [Streptomyces sp. CGMCC 4.7035]
MRFRVLGPVRMQPRTPTAAKPRVVLATLLVQSNSVVSTHSLIDELWGMEPPRTAATTLQVYVSQLRKALLEGGDTEERGQPLLTQPPGYLIRVGPDDLDLAVFESLRARGRAAYDERDYATASRLLADSLALWTGPALSGIPHGPALQATAIRLDELRSEVLEQRIGADLKLGRHQELIGELMALAHEFPMRETLHGLLMVALYRSGRQSDAVQAFHRVRRALVDELGVEPDASLKRILSRVLASDPALAWNPAWARAARPALSPSATVSALPAARDPERSGPLLWLPPALTDFTGRDEELARYERLLAASGAPRIVAVSGRPGVGKTTLAVQLAHRAKGFEAGRILLAMRDSAGRALTPYAAMSALLRRLLRPVPDVLPSEPEELADLLHRATRARELLLVLDDVVSEAQVRPLLAAVPDAAVVLTSRRPLGALEHARHLVLDVLAPRDARSLLLATGGPRMAEDPAAVDRIARLCGRLPLALRVAAGAVAVHPHWNAAGLARRLADERTRLGALSLGDLDVRGGLLAAYQEVSEAERHAFRTLGLAPLPDFPLWIAQSLLGMAPDAAEERLEGLVRSHLLEARPSADGPEPVRYGYHTLLRSLALDILDQVGGEEAATEATARLGRACLLRARAADARLTPGRDRLAGVLEPDLQGPAAHDPSVVVPLRWFQAEAPGLLEVLRRLHASGLWDLACALASATSGYYEACGLWDDWETGHELALDAARQAGNTLAEAVLLRSLGDLAWQRRHTGRAADYHRHAARLFTLVDDRVGAARCLTGEADVLLGLGEFDRAEGLYTRALEVAAEEGDTRGCAEARRGLALVALVAGRPSEGLAQLAECEAAARSLGDGRWRGYARRTADLVRGGDEGWARLEVRPGVWLMDDTRRIAA